MGVAVSEITIETMMATESVTANSRNNAAHNAAHHQDGNKKTAISDRLIVINV